MARGTPIGTIRIRRALLDVNVIADYLLQRQPSYKDCEAIVEASDRGRLDIYLAAFTVPTLYYILERDLSKILEPAPAAAEALRGIRFCLDAFLICPLDYGDLFEALSLPGRDYEDNLQITSAVNSHLDAIITGDKKFRSRDITVMTPAQLRKRLRI